MTVLMITKKKINAGAIGNSIDPVSDEEEARDFDISIPLMNNNNLVAGLKIPPKILMKRKNN